MNIPVVVLIIPAVGLKVFEYIGTSLCFNIKSFLFALSPAAPSYVDKNIFWFTVPYVKSGGVLSKSLAVYNIWLYDWTSMSESNSASG